jgi:coenzyme Q-binding protein COQ10
LNREPIRRKWSLLIPGCDVAAVFAAVADVECYPEFLPGVVGARIVRRDGARSVVENDFGFGPVRIRFRSIAEANPPNDLVILSRDGPWRDLSIRWRVTRDGRSCVLSCETRMEFRSHGLDLLARASMAGVEQAVISAFDRRLKSLARGPANDKPC